MRTLAAVLVGLCLAAGARADFKVVESVDVITLEDGSTVTGTIIVQGSKGIIIVKDGEEKLIPKDKVVKVEKGTPTAETKGYTTDPVEGQKVVTGEGFRDGGGGGEGGEAQKKTASTAPARGSSAPPRGGKITAAMVRQMMNRDPRIKTWVSMAGGPEKAAAILSDPSKRKELEQMAKNMGFNIPGGGRTPQGGRR